MKVPRTRIATTIADQTLKKGMSKDYAREVAALLLSEGRVGELDSLLRDVQTAWAEQGHLEVVARVAHPLDTEARQLITNQVRQLNPNVKQIVVTEVLDPEVLGGVQLELPGQQLDLSVEGKLNKFKQLTGAGKE